MLMEGTGKYFGFLFLVFLIVYVTVKISLATLLKRAKEQSWKGYVPIYTTYVLVELLNLKKNVFYMSLIPIVNLYYFYIIIGKLLEGFKLNSKEAIWFVVFPMYKFPELAFKKPKFALNEYELTEGFIQSQNLLFKKEAEELPDQIKLVNLDDVIQQAEQGQTIISPSNYEQVPEIKPIEPVIESQIPVEQSYQNAVQSTDSMFINQPSPEESVFTNRNLKPDEHYTTYVEVKEEEKQEAKPIAPLNDGKPKVCPKCGARLSSNATTCFLCGTKLN